MNITNQKLTTKKSIDNIFLFIASITVVIGLYFVYKLFKQFHDEVNTTTVSMVISGIIGPLFTLAGFFLLYLTFKSQKENFEKERLENNFFEMIKFHRENVSEMQYPYYEKKFILNSTTNPVRVEDFLATNKKVFTIIYNEFSEAYNELNPFFKNITPNEIYTTDYLTKLNANKTLKIRNIDLVIYAKVDIIYSIIFFGVSVNGKNAILNLLQSKYNQSFLNFLLDVSSLKPYVKSKYWLNWSAIQQRPEKIEILKSVVRKRSDINYNNNNLDKIPSLFQDREVTPCYPNKYVKYYGGHQFRLGHYFRHLYQSVSYIDSSEILTYSEKYKYIKFLRGQISTFEQIIFFLNSISSIGRIWELENSFAGDLEIQANRKLITKYNLIKNIPTNVIKEDINLTSFYPNVNYETIYVEGIIELRKHFANDIFT